MRLLASIVLTVSLSLAATSTARAFQVEHEKAAQAALVHGETPAHGDAHEEGEHGSKPGLLDWDIGSAFWSIVVFVILLVILRATAWKPILSALNQREEFVRKSLADAKHEREAAEKLLADYTKKLEKAREEASAIVDEGRRDAEEVRKRIHGEAKGEADAIVATARRDIQIARDDAVKKLHDETIMLATMLASKIVRKDLSQADHRRLLDESLEELSKARN